ncbi:MAG: radical SAM protein [Lachnospiraceae bacterium]|nr:radical SAM protein [Lachnospiraceae bacterium]MDE6252909.1 radical SAM protein [Lachnospiraceae bacterium]
MENSEHVKLLGIKVTNQCNLHCYMCGQWRQKVNTVQHIDFERICGVIDELAKASKYEVYLWGGEPFLYKDIIPLIKYIKSKKLKITINTNGTYLEKYAQELVECNVNRIIVSIDGNKEVHDSIRGVNGTYEKVISGVHKINEIKNLRPFITANTVITSRNYKCISKIVEELYKEGFYYIELQLPIFISNSMGERYQKVIENLYGIKADSWKGYQGDYFNIDADSLIEQINSMPSYVRIVPTLDNDQIFKYFNNYDESILEKDKCNVPFEQVRIEANGDVVICPDFPDVPIGNILVQNIGDILHSKRKEAFCQYLKKYGKIPICDKCVMYYES